MKREHHAALPPGTLLGEFRIESVLGQGGFGITYLAHDTALDRPVAVKEYLPVELAVRVGGNTVQPLTSGHVDTYGWGLARFLDEARTLARFRHPNIVRVLRVMEDNGTAYMVMELEEGRSCEDAVKFRKLEGEAALRATLLPLLDGLEHVHQAGFVHRDIKPANIMVRPDGTPVLIDFGSARQSLGAETRTMTALVTEGYAPFEQYNASPDDDRQGPWTDIYSLAATLYGIVTGKPPVSALVRANALLEGKPDPVAPAAVTAGAGWSPGFLNAIDRALAFRAADRPQSVAAWREMLEGEPDEAAGRTVLRDPPPRAAATAPLQTAPAAARDTSGGAVARPPRRGRGLAVVVVLLLLGAAAGGGWSWWQGEQRAREAAALVTRAGNALAAGRLFAPAGDSALAAYREALATDPQNAAARAGLEALPGAAARLAAAALEAGDTDRARALLEAAAELPGSDAALAPVRERLTAALEPSPPPPAPEPEVPGGATDLAESGAEAGLPAADDPSPPVPESPTEEDAAAVEQPPAPSPAEPAPTSPVQALLAEAAAAFAAGRLAPPEEDSATEAWSRVLALDPGNAEARDGLARVAARLLEAADRRLGDGDTEAAAALVERAAGVRPDAEGLDVLRERVAATRAAAARAAEVADLLQRGDAALAALRLTSPADDNAVMHYRAALELDSRNTRAEAGLDRVVERYVDLADAAVADGEPARAKSFLERAAGVRPDSSALADARTRLAAARAAEREAGGRETGDRERGEPMAGDVRVAPAPEGDPADTGGPAPARVFRDALAAGGEGPEMVRLAAGRFDMGSPAGETGREPDERLHPVAIGRDFAVGRFEVTFEEFDRFARATGRPLPPDQGWGRGRQPVVGVTWEDAAGYAAWLSEQTGRRYRLPTEAEWEYAARAGSPAAWWWGAAAPAGRANCADCGSAWDGRRPAPVGSFPASPAGLHDTAGNVWEWTCSGYDPRYGGAEQGCATQRGGSRVIRGGAFLQRAPWLRSANRSQRLAHERLNTLGFRVVRDL